MRILVTGLCLQGNKGGPALAASLLVQLRTLFKGAEITMAVPANEFALEAKWAETYGVTVVSEFNPVFGPLATLLGRSLRGQRPGLDRAWFAALRSADLLVDLSGISYVGRPIGTRKGALLAPRFKAFVLCRLLRKPFLAWTQSYGPFSDRTTRLLARWDLGRQPVIFCRGEDCRQAVQALLPGAIAEDFPDVAITLPYDAGFGDRYLEARGIDAQRLVTLSPSAVLYEKLGAGDRNLHVEHVAALCERLRQAGHAPLLVPHTLRPTRPDARVCDHAVCLSVQAHLAERGLAEVPTVSEDLSPMDLKAIISRARLHVGGRYHSLVAALSSGVPSVGLSWHPKYRDILRQYGAEDWALEETAAADFGDRLWALAERLLRERACIHGELQARQSRLVSRVEANANAFRECYESLRP